MHIGGHAMLACGARRSKTELRSQVSHYLNGVNQVDDLMGQFRVNVKEQVLAPLSTMLQAHAELQVRIDARAACFDVLL